MMRQHGCLIFFTLFAFLLIYMGYCNLKSEEIDMINARAMGQESNGTKRMIGFILFSLGVCVLGPVFVTWIAKLVGQKFIQKQ
jgi:hypothetical protein